MRKLPERKGKDADTYFKLGKRGITIAVLRKLTLGHAYAGSVLERGSYFESSGARTAKGKKGRLRGATKKTQAKVQKVHRDAPKINL